MVMMVPGSVPLRPAPFGNLDPGGILISTTNEHESDTTGIMHEFRLSARRPE